MQIILIIVGAVLGTWLSELGREGMGLGLGAMAGYLFSRQRKMQRQIDEQANQLRRNDVPFSPAPTDKPARSPDEPPPIEIPDLEAPAPVSLASARAMDTPVTVANRGEPSEDSSEGWATLDKPAKAAGPTPLDKAVSAAKQWLTTGNVPVKIGVIVSFFGVAFLLKYAVDQQMLSLPIELRYLGIAAGAMAMLGFGWHLRQRLPVYGLSLQGGGIGILFLIIFGAFRLHPLIPAPLAFVLLIGLTIAAGVLAVAQNARSLAVLGIVGGFLAPVLISTGSGNHVALFSYYLLLNAAVLGIAWYRSWRFLNVIGFVFTFGVAAAWGARSYQPELLASTLPFLIAYFLFYQAIAILFAFRQPPNLKGLVDGTLVFGTPVIAFALQSQMVKHTDYGLAISAITIAVFFILVALGLSKTQGSKMRLLIESYVALGVAFATVAVPLALDGSWTAVAWALEGAALIWVGVRQSGMLARLSGTALVFGSGLAFLEQGWRADVGLPVLNANFLGSLLIAVAALFSSCYLSRDQKPLPLQWVLSIALLLWGLAWWTGAGIVEIADRADSQLWGHLFIAYWALSAWLLAAIARRFQWRSARIATLGYLPLLTPVTFLYLLDGRLFDDSISLALWPLAGAAHLAVMRYFEPGRQSILTLWHLAGLLMFASIGYVEVAGRMIEADVEPVWTLCGAMVVPFALALLILALKPRIGWPLRQHWQGYLGGLIVLVCGVLALTALAGTQFSGNPAPLPYVPVLNPMDLLTIAGLVLTLKLIAVTRQTTHWLDAQRTRFTLIAWGVAAFVLTTIAVVRGVHHLLDVPWSGYELRRSVYVQSALSIYWAVLGFAGMWWGARSGQRGIWLTGTALMALVVAKLFLVDLGNTDTVARIVSFLGVGVLLLVVGYLAPAPPKQPLEQDVEDLPDDPSEEIDTDEPTDNPAEEKSHD